MFRCVLGPIPLARPVPLNVKNTVSSLQEKLERAEDAAHISSKHIGVTIALIGVLIAFCAAMVSSEQNELTRTMT